MIQHIRPAIVMTALFTALLGLGYPLAMTGIASAIVPNQAGGSLIEDGSGHVIGSALIAQGFGHGAYGKSVDPGLVTPIKNLRTWTFAFGWISTTY